MSEEKVYSAKTRPQRLCKMCGKCCTMAVPQYSYEDLKEFSNCKESEAGDFLEVLKPYENLDIPREICNEYVEIVLEKLKEQEKYEENKPIFYHCKYVGEDNKCLNYENRYGWCHRAPSHGWTLMPVGCGFEGWQFGLREQIKHNIRQLKEYLYECEMIYGEGIIPSQKISVADFRAIVMEKVKAFERFGSFYW